ncbi:MAG: endonuclease/exonuclease/phosphatase family protein [Xanthomonadaceae bacterium]|nr:endonuclease/exonuclease/phosphatase family protein [Xanthomonadaceae bacterium]
MDITLLSYNIHKGFDFLSRKFVLEEIRTIIRDSGANIVCLQEILGAHSRYGKNIPSQFKESQMEFLADTMWPHYSYGKNAVYEDGHHGNCILSKFPIIENHNCDLSIHRFEKRGMLMTKILVPESQVILNILTTHLNLLERHRVKQVSLMEQSMKTHKLAKQALILAGDFNDWRGSLQVEKKLDLSAIPPEASFPSIFPYFALDRIYFRDLELISHEVLSSPTLKRLSDHLPVVARFKI